MRVGVDFEQCEANGVCAGVAPEVFELDDDDALHVLPGEVPADSVERVTQAVDSCPKNALFIR
jgi:ferredoxin